MVKGIQSQHIAPSVKHFALNNKETNRKNSDSRVSENHDLLTGILRDEWGFEGMVSTDWWTYGEHYKEVFKKYYPYNIDASWANIPWCVYIDVEKK